MDFALADAGGPENEKPATLSVPLSDAVAAVMTGVLPSTVASSVAPDACVNAPVTASWDELPMLVVPLLA